MSAPCFARRAACLALVVAALLSFPTRATAEPWWVNATRHLRYMAMGDSIAAGRGAMPQTEGYVYLLYRSGVIDDVDHIHFSNAAVSEATSANVLLHQLPQALPGENRVGFQPDVITITVGGNDLFALLRSPDPTDPELVMHVISAFAANMAGVFATLCADPHLRNARVFVSNQYEVPEIDALIPGASFVVRLLNDALATVAQRFDATIVDVHRAFEGRRGLILGERRGADRFEAHPTNKGHLVIAHAFKDAMKASPGRLNCADDLSPAPVDDEDDEHKKLTSAD